MMKKNRTLHKLLITVLAATFLMPLITLIALVTILQFTTTPTSAQTDFRQAAEDTLKNGMFMAAFSGNALVPAYSDSTQTPEVSRADVINVVATALERERLTNLAAVVQTTSNTVDSQMKDGNVTYSITLPVSTFIDCGVESAERLVVYTVKHAETEPVYILKSLVFTVSPNPSNVADELVTIKLPSAVTVLVFDSKNDGDREETTAERETTSSPTMSNQVKTISATTVSSPIKLTQQVTTKSQESTGVFEPEYEQGVELEESTDESEEDSSPKTGELNLIGRLDVD